MGYKKEKKKNYKKEKKKDPLENWLDVLNKQGEEREKAIKKFWKNLQKKDLMCANAVLKPLIISDTKILLKRKIDCKLTGKYCVCSYHSLTWGGFILSDTCVNCPSFRKRILKKKRRRIK